MKKVLLLLSFAVAAFVLKAQNPYPIIPLDSVQRTSFAKLSQNPPIDSPDYVSPRVNARYGDTVRIEGYVLFDPRYYGLSISRKSTILVKDTIGGAWGGVEVICDPAVVGMGNGVGPLTTLINDNSFYDNVKPGYKVRVTGIIRAAFTSGSAQYNTQLYLLKGTSKWNNGVEVIDFGPNKLNPVVLPIDSITTGNPITGFNVNKSIGEKWEGVYVELRNVSVYNDRAASGASRWTWSVTDKSGNAISIRDYSGYYRNDALTADSVFGANNKRFTPPPIGKSFAYLRGVIQEYSLQGATRYGIAPLYTNDLGPALYTPPTIAARARTPVAPSSSDSIRFTYKIQQNDAALGYARVFYSKPNDNTLFDSVSLTKVVVGIDTGWTAQIAPMPDGSQIYYYIKAYDVNDIANKDTFGTAKSFIVRDGGITNIRQLQFSTYNNNSSIFNGDSAITNMNIRALVTSNDMLQGAAINFATVQQGTGANAAIIVNRKLGDATSTWAQGDSVLITAGKVIEAGNMTTLNDVSATKISSNHPVPAPINTLNIDTLALWNSDARPVGARQNFNAWEGQVIGFDTNYVVSSNPDGPASDFQEFSLSNDKNASLSFRVNDLGGNYRNTKFNAALKNGQKAFRTAGILYFLNGNWKINPRSLADLDIDTVMPRIKVKGANPKTVLLGTSYTDAGATATDNNVVVSMTSSGTVDVNTLGVYKITYIATDLALLTDTAYRTVTVANTDVTKPVISLKGNNPDTLIINTSYVDPGAKAIDDVEDDISSKIIRTGSIDSSVIGTYVLTYTVSDLAGNTASKTRTVIVGFRTSINENDLQSANILVYPSPANNVLFVEASGYKSLPLQVTLTDLLGRDIISKQINSKQVKEEFDVTNLKNGIYFITLSNDAGSKSIKFVVSGK